MNGFFSSTRYQQEFDLEGETGLVVRSIGTSVTLTSDTEVAFSTPVAAQSPEQLM